mmetsp:Transcript_34424/g.135425  ORF Transcript_34424/g.135425 Transcript_34424/m.135425 type:complete len:422 (-) Transcript_34424:2803-4068(-)
MFQGYHLRNSTFRNTRPGQELTGWLFQVKSSGVIRSRRKKRLVKLQGHRLTVLDAQTGDVKQDLYLSAGSVDGVPEDKVLTISIKTKKLVLVAETEKEYTQWLSSFTYAFRRLEQYYELGKEIGRGAFSIVRQGRMRENSKPVAVKVIQNIGEARFLHRNEIEILARVEHENIVQTHDVFERKTETYIVMEYMRGGELYDVIAEADSFSEKISREVLRDILKGIQYLHSNGIVHRDLKPENLLCNSKIFPPLVKIADFGLSAYLGSDRGEMLNTLVGSPGYVAPEILLKIPYSKPVDMWAVGVIFHQMLTSLLPYSASSEREYVDMALIGPKFEGSEWDGISVDARNLITSLLSFDPGDRPSAEMALKHPFFKSVRLSSQTIARQRRSLLHSCQRSSVSVQKEVIPKRLTDSSLISSSMLL